MPAHWIVVAADGLPSVSEWAQLTIGTAALLVLMLTILGTGVLAWKLGPKVFDHWQRTIEALKDLAHGFKTHCEAEEAHFRKMEHDMERLHNRLDKVA